MEGLGYGAGRSERLERGKREVNVFLCLINRVPELTEFRVQFPLVTDEKTETERGVAAESGLEMPSAMVIKGCQGRLLQSLPRFLTWGIQSRTTRKCLLRWIVGIQTPFPKPPSSVG